MGRQVPDFGLPDGLSVCLMECPNVPASIAFAVTSGLASLYELQTVYGVEDLWDLVEIHSVNLHNAAKVRDERH